MNIILVALLILILNLPFGYWRTNVKKFSLQWILAIHLPVPIVIAIRILSGLGFQLYTYPILIGSFFLGQYAGSYLFKYRKSNMKLPLTSCLCWDIVKSFRMEEESSK
jgi:hypothetical protein